MGWRFRRTFKVLPGVRLNVSKSGISTSIGGAPFTVNLSSRGIQSTASIPGTGLSFRQHSSSPSGGSRVPLAPPSPVAPALPQTPSHLVPAPQLVPAGPTVDLGEEIRSAGTDVLTSSGLAAFKDLLLQADKECNDINAEIAKVKPAAAAARTRHQRWDRGFLFKRIRKAKFAELAEAADTGEAHLAELEEQAKLARLATDITVDTDIAGLYARLCDTFAVLSQSKCIWDTLTRKATNRVAERTLASESITRERVQFKRGQSDILTCEWHVPCLENRSGGDMYVYPAFILYRMTRETFAMIGIQDANIEFVPSRFIEREAIPADSPTVGNTWAKVNKNGTPDKRFKDNFQIPIVQYGTLKLSSSTGLNEEYMVSNARSAEEFSKAWAAFKKSFPVVH
jgi:hypothetical protein